MKRQVIDAVISAGTCVLAFAIPIFFVTIAGIAAEAAKISLPRYSLPIVVLVLLLAPWFAIRGVQSLHHFAVPYPMNAFGGAMMGLALAWPWIMGLMMANEYVRRTSMMAQIGIFIAPMIAFVIVVLVAGSLAALAKWNIAIPLLVASPFVAIGSLLIIMFFGGT